MNTTDSPSCERDHKEPRPKPMFHARLPQQIIKALRKASYEEEKTQTKIVEEALRARLGLPDYPWR